MSSMGGGLVGQSYRPAAIILHWLIAACLIAQIGIGWYMGDLADHSPARNSVMTFHKSFGLTILLLTAARLLLAITYRPPPLPVDIAPWERRLSSLIHGLFYVLLFALPLTGWAMVSMRPRPIPFWGLVWPHLPGIDLVVTEANRHQIQHLIEPVHTSILVWTTIVLIGLHVLGALKHQFDGSPVLWRMVPWLRRR